MTSPRFISADHRIRTAIGSAGLVGIGGLSLSALGGRRKALHQAERRWSALTRRFLRLELEATGLDHIDPDEQYVVMPLHEGFIDLPMLLHLPLDLRFTVRQELLSMEYVGPYVAATRQILIPETPTVSGYKSLYADIEVAITEGDSIVIFPQGSVLGVEVAFKAGVSLIARRFGLPVLPVVISGTHRVWEYPFTQTVRFGQSVAMTVLPPVTPGDATIERIRQIESDMKSLALSNPQAPVRRFHPQRDGWWDGYSFDIDADFPELSSDMTHHRSRSGSPSGRR